MTTTWQYKIDPHDKNRHYICYTDIGFARSEDAGQTWYWAARGSPWQNTFYDVEFDPDVPGRMYAACAYEHDIPSWKMAQSLYGGGGVCISTDYGKTWKPSADGMPQLGACTAVEVDPKSPKDARVLYASFWGGGVFKSIDGGKTWQAEEQGAAGRCQRSLHGHPATQGWHAVGAVRRQEAQPARAGRGQRPVPQHATAARRGSASPRT